MPVTVRFVAPGSAAHEIGFVPGTKITKINDFEVRDAIDFLYLTADTELTIECEEPDGEPWCAEIELAEGEELGIELEADRVRVCANHCIFCFVDQMPPGMRKTLYIKDDDWRTSFLHGSYVTLTNLRKEDIDRIISWHISPLYVSVHASDDDVRAYLLGNNTGNSSFDKVRMLAQAGIQMHTQAVVCEGINDGEILRRTIQDLYALRPNILSLSIVPVGLTKHRVGLSPLAPISAQGARDILTIVRDFQKKALSEIGTRFVFASDELYVLAGEPFPDSDTYEDYSQLENGVGIVTDFITSAQSAIRRLQQGGAIKQKVRIGAICGLASEPALSSLLREVHEKLGIDVELLGIENTFFGPTVNVSGLLTGQDVLEALKGRDWDAVLTPYVMFRDAGDRTLDDVSPEDISRETGITCVMAPLNGDGYIERIWDLASKGK